MTELMYVISVGAGKNQIPLIKRLIERGYNIVSFDKNDSCPGKQLSYKFNNISTWDYESAIRWLDSLGLKYKGVLCFSYGRALITQQKIIEHYNMNCKIRDKFIHTIENKKLQREILTEFGLSNLIEYDYHSEVISSYHKKKLVVKNKTGVSSNDINLIRNEDCNYKFLEDIARNDNYIIQEYLDGEEYRIVAIVKDTKVKFLSIMERINMKDTFFTGRLSPQKYYSKDIIALVEKVIEKFEIKDSTLKLDIIKDENRIEILEIDFGIGGDYFETVISPKCYNYNFIDNYINLMLGLQVDISTTLDNELCFDYIYNNSKKDDLIVDYNKIFDIARKYFSDFEIVKIKEQDQIVKYPKSNMDAVFGIIHSRKDLSNYEIGNLFNESLAK